MPTADRNVDADVRDLLDFVCASPTPYHAAAEAARRLEAGGYTRFDECQPWDIRPGVRAYLVKNGGTIVAFHVGNDAPEAAGFLAVAAHTDSPNLRVKPNPETTASGFRQLGVEVYGGVLLSTWLDRDLSIAGRVSVAGGRAFLARLDGPLCRVPNLAIHLNRDVNREGLVLNPQKHMVPIVGLGREGWGSGNELRARLVVALREASVVDLRPEEILAYDLCLYDAQPPAIGGLDNELVFSARLDNLASSHAALVALLEARAPAAATRVVVLYDHEEVGSRSAQGAASRFLLSILSRLTLGFAASGTRSPQTGVVERAIARSLLVSADMAHGVHPNYSDKHDPEHAPVLGGGPVIKINVNQSYATDSATAAVFEEACQAAGFAPQRFVSRNDQPCGSTVGPITAAALGIRAVDVGNPMLSMHSAREACAAADVPRMIGALGAIFAGIALPSPSVLYGLAARLLAVPFAEARPGRKIRVTRWCARVGRADTAEAHDPDGANDRSRMR